MSHSNFYVDIRMFGEFDILVDDKSLFNEFTRLPIIMELLQYMIANYGEELSPSKILDDIWSDKDYQDISKVLRTYIYRLKQFLSGNNSLEVDISDKITISNYNGRYKLEVSRDCLLDIRTFDTSVRRFDSKLINMENVEYIKEIAEIYRGDFLQNNLYAHWVVPLRSLYLGYFSWLNNIVLEIYSGAKEYMEVIRYAEQIFEVYDLDEKANVHFLNALINEGRASDALQHYSYITSKLYTELNIRPCDELKEIYSLLKNPVIIEKPEEEIIEEKTNEEVLSIHDIQDEFVKKFPRNFKKYKLDGRQDIAIGLFRLLKEKDESILSSESGIIYKSIKDVLNIILIKDYYFNYATNDTFILFIRDAKENFVGLISEQLKNYISSNTFVDDIKVEVEIKMVSPLKREKGFYSKESVKYEEGK